MKSDCLELRVSKIFPCFLPEASARTSVRSKVRKSVCKLEVVIFMVKRQKFLSFYEQSSSTDGNTLAHTLAEQLVGSVKLFRDGTDFSV